ncbi:hypothetical protein PV783_33470 [Chitinophaga sp. CC14]|uniref:hypothetical protein n=1 Tax=Chitinophaga sp. CC14 TaxID=3029199 RepID=UPI003B7A8833
MKRSGLMIICLVFLFTGLKAQEWQWSVPVTGIRKNNPRAWLWIPPGCKQVKGVVVAQHNMEEVSILEDVVFREKMAALNFAEIWVSPPFDHLFRFNEGAGEVFDSMLLHLAAVSGYEELIYAPVVPMGHSAAASWPYYFAAWKPERTLAAVSVSGQWPYFRDATFAPDIWGNRNIDFVPCLETMGEYEAADTWSIEGLKERAAHPYLPLSMLACPAEGHFASTAEKAAYIAFYIGKAVQYRLPQDYNGKGYPQLKQVDPTHTGWLADRWAKHAGSRWPAAAVAGYTGNAAEAFWFFDEETARATVAYGARFRGKQPQLAGFVQLGVVAPQHNTHQQVDLRFIPEKDGIHFSVGTVFMDTVPGGSPRLTAWTELPVGAPLKHAAAADIKVRVICGPAVATGANQFRLQFRPGMLPDTTGHYDIWLAAVHPGDAAFKPSVQQARMVVPAMLAGGRPQRISFDSMPDIPYSKKDVQLKATSDAGLPVHYFVLEGPAHIRDSRVYTTAIPYRSRFPVKVTIGAWQYGIKDSINTAVPVYRSFYITRK